MAIGDRNPIYDEQSPDWELAFHLLGGTRRMREARRLYLPQEKKESNENYDVRVGRSFLFNAFRRSRNELAARPFSKALQIEFPNEEWIQNIDLQGTPLAKWALEFFRVAIAYGGGFIVCDYPVVPVGASLEDEKKAKARPYLYHYSPRQAIDWDIDDAGVITRIDFQQTPNLIKRWTTLGWEIYERKESTWVLTSAGVHTFGKVPIVVCQLLPMGQMIFESPLLDLAYINVEHWQASSDQRNILRFSRFGLLFASGFDEEEYDKGLEIGPARLIKSKNPEASLEYVESTGSPNRIGFEDLDRLEAKMQAMSAAPLVLKPGNETATGKAIDSAKESCELQQWAEVLDDSIVQALVLLLEIGKAKGEPKFTTFKDFGVTHRGPEEAGVLLQARTQSEISRRTFLNEWKRRGLLADDLDVDVEAAAAASEAPNVGTTGI